MGETVETRLRNDVPERAMRMETIMAEHESALLRYATRILNNASAAEDVVQGVFVKLFRAWKEGMKPSDQLKSWLYRVTHNEAIDHLRKESRLQALHEKLKGRGLVILAVDLAEKPDVVRKYVRDTKLTFPILMDTTGEVGGAWGAQSIPTTYIIDKGGRVIARGIGAQWKWDSPEIVALFEKLL